MATRPMKESISMVDSGVVSNSGLLSEAELQIIFYNPTAL